MSDRGVTATNEGQVAVANIPLLSEERRRDLVKQAKGKAEDGRISLRGVRRKAMDELKRIRIMKGGGDGADE